VAGTGRDTGYAQVMREQGVWPYNETTGTGELRYVQLTANSHAASSRPSPAQYAAATVQMALVWNATTDDVAAVARAEMLAAALWARHGAVQQVRLRFPYAHSQGTCDDEGSLLPYIPSSFTPSICTRHVQARHCTMCWL
jgi:hypothetical protein